MPEKITVIRFKAICGRTFASKQGAIRHEKACMCFTNPAYKSCRTCKHEGDLYNDSDGSDNVWPMKDCNHPESGLIDFDLFSISSKALDCIGCPFWENDLYSGPFEDWKAKRAERLAQEEISIWT